MTSEEISQCQSYIQCFQIDFSLLGLTLLLVAEISRQRLELVRLSKVFTLKFRADPKTNG